MPPVIDREWLSDQVKKYADLHPRYLIYADLVNAVLRIAAKEVCKTAIIQSRAKDIRSFAGKCVRTTLKEPATEFTDLSGARAIVQLLPQVTAMEEWVRRHFTIDEVQSQNTKVRLSDDAFGYLSVHLIVLVNPSKLPPSIVGRDLWIGMGGDPALWASPPDKPPPLTSEAWEQVRGLKAEVQIRTMSQHAWSDVGHDLIYKSPFTVPANYRRQSAKIAALLEEVDSAFEELTRGIMKLRSNAGTYRNTEETIAEIDRMQAALDHDPDNLELIEEIARQLVSISRFDEAVAMCDKTGCATHALRTYKGRALCLAHRDERHDPRFREGQQLLEQSHRERPNDLEAATFLAESHVGANNKLACQIFQEAFEADPEEPRALGGFLRLRMSEGRNDHMLSLLWPNINAAAQRCRDQIAVQVNLPDALYHLAEFLLLQQRPREEDLSLAYEGLFALCRAIRLTAKGSWLLDEVRGRFKLLLEIAHDRPWLQWADRTLSLAAIVKETRKSVQEATPLVPSLEIQKKGIVGPVLIMAGGCEKACEEKLQDYGSLLESLLRDYSGTILCGGTREGISGLVGSLCKERNRISGAAIRAIGYLPKAIPTETATVAPELYPERPQSGGFGRFTAAEPLQSWIDILYSGISPEQVTLIGINGGEVAGFEYHLAAALGAKVAILRDSGRQADLLMLDEHSPGNDGIFFVPPDPESLRAVLAYPPRSSFAPSDVLTMAADVSFDFDRHTHALKFLERRQSLEKDPDLQQAFDTSNEMQIHHIPEKLKRIGKKMVKVEGRKPVLITLTDDEIKQLAEMEHGRWVVERTWAGWTLGPRDDKKRQRPQLIPWRNLDSTEQEKDYHAIRRIPEILALVGYEIVDDSRAGITEPNDMIK